MTPQESDLRSRLDEFIDSVKWRDFSREELLGRRFDLGLARVDNQVGEGGLCYSADLQEVVRDELGRHGLLDDSDIRAREFDLFGALLVAHGTPAQRRRYLRSMYTGQERWCQLSSEPNAGSDLLNLATQARRDGDRWIINGSKIWTSLAHKATFGLLIARHDPDLPKSKGLTAFILDMKQSGVQVRPIRQLTGDAEFNQIFFTDAIVPDENRLGEVGDGVKIIFSTISSQRLGIGGEAAARDRGPLAMALELWQEAPRKDPVTRDRLARLWIENEVLSLTSQRTWELYKANREGPSPNVIKLAYTQLLQRGYELAVDLLGPEGLLFPEGYEFKMYDFLELEGHDAQWAFLAARGRTIGGGTSEIVRTTIGERVLGLPREPRVDQDRPWREVSGI